MKIDDLASKIDQAKIFNLEYEFRINKLKLDYIHLQKSLPQPSLAGSQNGDLSEAYRADVEDFRHFVRLNFNHFDAASCSSLSCIPTRGIGDEEKFIHRIWMGGALPAIAREAIEQWGAALEEVQNSGGAPYISILWVWDEAQLRLDPLFSPTGGVGKYAIGRYSIGGNALHVNSLRDLADDFAKDRFDALNELHTQRYFATLSDYFRVLILCEYGGIYMDVDTIPHKPATIFLMKPEVPDYFHLGRSGETGQIGTYHVSWMNLFLDETGMMVAKKNDASLKRMLEHIHARYADIPRAIPHGCPQFESGLFDVFYAEWKKNIGLTFLSHDDFYRNYSVLYDARKESVVGGIRGMRLLVDIITGIDIPLSEQERQAYAHCLARLEGIAWTLDDPLTLENIVDVFFINEAPRMAYPAQLRAEIDHFHYYSVLSTDADLDRVNTIFCRYLIASNSKKISEGKFWRPTVGQHAGKAAGLAASPGAAAEEPAGRDAPDGANGGLLSHDPIRKVAGHALSEDEKNHMAKLIFSTSYLEYCSVGNKLNLQFVELQRRQNIDQYLDYIQGLRDGADNFIGFFTAATMDEFNGCNAVSYYRDEMRALDGAYDEFVLANSRGSDYFVSSLALDEKFQGRGFFNQMLNEIKDMARHRQCGRITLTVWEKSAAYSIYLKKGFTVSNTFDYAFPIFYDKLHFLEYDLGQAAFSQE
ncbi:GNAT family N-acetyltransferase [Janthinobacterium fluminis]|uniref:Glycosyltransferase n=1 Tax=Janthinobacterium fluminis TaxID=2987524 RepID=A0ABT5K2V0_9BURK|nr:GNAT family N-acetyltransferase [Janthinobacterium fluminis]MDC8759229.1 glycosyltransferase [Janthinobacterium fluminis]